MRLRDALKLQNGDEVTIKAKYTDSGVRETVKVQQAYEDQDTVLIEAMTSDGYRTLTHWEVL